MDRSQTKILVIVAAKQGENPCRRRGQVSSAMFVSRGLVGPKTYRNSSTPKGKQVNIPVPFSTKSDIFGQAKRCCRAVQASKPVESRNGEKRANL